MEVKDWLSIVTLLLAAILNSVAVFKGIKALSTDMVIKFGDVAKEAINIHRQDASESEKRFLLLERNMERLTQSDIDRKDQLLKIEDMLSEIREAMFSLLKKP